MPYLVVEDIPGHRSDSSEPTRFPRRDDAVRFATDLSVEYRERGYRVKRSRLMWTCELSRREPAIRIEVLEVSGF